MTEDPCLDYGRSLLEDYKRSQSGGVPLASLEERRALRFLSVDHSELRGLLGISGPVIEIGGVVNIDTSGINWEKYQRPLLSRDQARKRAIKKFSENRRQKEAAIVYAPRVLERSTPDLSPQGPVTNKSNRWLNAWLGNPVFVPIHKVTLGAYQFVINKRRDHV